MANSLDGFTDAGEQELGQRFLDEGRVILTVQRPELLERVRKLVVRLASKHLGVDAPTTPLEQGQFLNRIHERVQPTELNELRLAVIRGLNDASWTRPALYRMAKDSLSVLCGSELAMQRRPNLSVQLPGDDSSLLALHSDVWSGDSPYEVVLWLPLVNCYGTKSMYLIPPKADAELRRQFAAGAGGTCEELFERVEPHVEFMAVSYGELMLFTQTLGHGNRINTTEQSRWSINVRFKGLYTPYGDKGMGSFFEPITLKPASRVGLDYQEPGAFDE